MPIANLKPVPSTSFQNKKALPPNGITFTTELELYPVSTERWQIFGLKLTFGIPYFHDGVYINSAAFKFLVERKGQIENAHASYLEAQTKAPAGSREFFELGAAGFAAEAEKKQVESELKQFGFEPAREFFLTPAYTLIGSLYRSGELLWTSKLDPNRFTVGPIEFGAEEAHSIMKAETLLRENELIQFQNPLTLNERQRLTLAVTIIAPPNELAEFSNPGGGVAVGFSSSFELSETGVTYSPEVRGQAE